VNINLWIDTRLAEDDWSVLVVAVMEYARTNTRRVKIANRGAVYRAWMSLEQR